MPDTSADEDQRPAETPNDWPPSEAIGRGERRNFLLLAVHMIAFRVGWIFKTESVIMPAVLDAISGQGWVRGLLPILSRTGQTIPPILAADALRRSRRKRNALSGIAMAMAIPFGAFAVLWFLFVRPVDGDGVGAPPWMTVAFLAMYGAYFVLFGLYQMSFGTVQGKLIRPTRRGMLLYVSSLGSSPPACLAAWFLLGWWLGLPGGGFAYVFTSVAIFFFVSGLITTRLAEPPDEVADDKPPSCEAPSMFRRGWHSLAETYHTLRDDANLRMLVVAAALFGSQIIVLPHYQALGREQLGLSGVNLMVWTITQNISVGLFATLFGRLGDKLGYRLAMRLAMFTVAIAPVLAVALPRLPGGIGAHVFPVLYVFLAIVPIVLRAIQNYTLEIARPEDHPRYLSTVQLGYAIPFVAAPLVGWLVDAVGFHVVFLGTTTLTLLAGLMTFRLIEPRHIVASDGENFVSGAE